MKNDGDKIRFVKPFRRAGGDLDKRQNSKALSIAVRFPPKLYKEILAKAVEANCSFAEMVRRLLTA